LFTRGIVVTPQKATSLLDKYQSHLASSPPGGSRPPVDNDDKSQDIADRIIDALIESEEVKTGGFLEFEFRNISKEEGVLFKGKEHFLQDIIIRLVQNGNLECAKGYNKREELIYLFSKAGFLETSEGFTPYVPVIGENIAPPKKSKFVVARKK
jgi:hypothetical protein